MNTAGSKAWYWLRADRLIFILAIPGVYVLRKKPIYLIWLIISLGFLLVWETKWDQYVMVMLVPYCLAAGEAVDAIWNWAKSRINVPA